MKVPRMLAMALAGVASLTLAGPAGAQPLERGTFHDEFTEIVENFCDVPGLTAQLDSVVDGRFLVNRHGSDGLVYGMELISFADTWTNVANGNTVTVRERSMFKDLRVTDNGDGTLKILVLGTGNFTVYGEDGKAIARNPGQLRFELLIDHAGTPDDPFDDEFIDFLGVVKDSTGRNDDFCEAAVPALTG